MPLYEYECDSCMEKYNTDVSSLVEKLNKTNASKVMKNNPGIYYIEVLNGNNKKLLFSLG